MDFLESLLGLGQGVGLIIIFVLIIKIWYWCSLYNGIAKIENITYKFANKQIKQNEKIIENQMEIIRLLGGKVEEVEEEPEEDEEDVDKTIYV